MKKKTKIISSILSAGALGVVVTTAAVAQSCAVTPSPSVTNEQETQIIAAINGLNNYDGIDPASGTLAAVTLNAINQRLALASPDLADLRTVQFDNITAENIIGIGDVDLNTAYVAQINNITGFLANGLVITEGSLLRITFEFETTGEFNVTAVDRDNFAASGTNFGTALGEGVTEISFYNRNVSPVLPVNSISRLVLQALTSGLSNSGEEIVEFILGGSVNSARFRYFANNITLTLLSNEAFILTTTEEVNAVLTLTFVPSQIDGSSQENIFTVAANYAPVTE